MSDDRRLHLRNYILACVRDNVLSLSDLASAGIVDKLLSAISADVRTVLAELGRTGASNGLRIIGERLSRFAEDLLPRGKRCR